MFTLQISFFFFPALSCHSFIKLSYEEEKMVLFTSICFRYQLFRLHLGCNFYGIFHSRNLLFGGHFKCSFVHCKWLHNFIMTSFVYNSGAIHCTELEARKNKKTTLNSLPIAFYYFYTFHTPFNNFLYNFLLLLYIFGTVVYKFIEFLLDFSTLVHCFIHYRAFGKWWYPILSLQMLPKIFIKCRVGIIFFYSVRVDISE